MLLAIVHFCIKNVLTFVIWSNGSEKTRSAYESNQKSKDIFDAKMGYGQQHFLVGFFTPGTPSHTSFSDPSLSVAWSFIRQKL